MKKSNVTQLLSKVLCNMPNVPLMPDLWMSVSYRLNNNVCNNTIYIVHDICTLLNLRYALSHTHATLYVNGCHGMAKK